MQRLTQTLRRILAIAGIFVIGTAEARAQSPALLPPEQGLLVLQTGKVMSGRISGGPPFGYTVQLPQGKILVPVEQVQFRCEDLREAYLRLRSTVQADDVLGHVTLARWCVTYNRIEEAREELELELKLAHDRDETRRLLARLNGGVDGTDPQPEQTRTKRGFTQSDITAPESIGGLPHELGAQFSRRIQPLLMNSCSSGACHAPRGKREFELSIVRSGFGMNRHTAEANLRAVMGQVDLAHPEASPLLKAAAGHHGVRGRQIFQGRKGEEQLRELRDWVVAVAAERRSDRFAADSAPPVKDRQAPGAPKSKVSPAVATEPVAVAPRPAEPKRLNPAPSAPVPSEGAVAAEKLAAETALPGSPELSSESGSEAPDAFDPEIFNRETRRRKNSLGG